MFQHFLKCHSNRINYDGHFHILKKVFMAFQIPYIPNIPLFIITGSLWDFPADANKTKSSDF